MIHALTVLIVCLIKLVSERRVKINLESKEFHFAIEIGQREETVLTISDRIAALERAIDKLKG